MALIDSRLEVTPEAIIEAAKKCPQAKEVLKTLFPRLFSNRPPKIVPGQIYRNRERDRDCYFLVTRFTNYTMETGRKVYLQLTSLESGNMWSGAFEEGKQETVENTFFWGSCGADAWVFVGFSDGFVKVMEGLNNTSENRI